VSVIVPVLDEADCLPDLADHLHALRAAGCEPLIVDGGSTDGTCKGLEATGLPWITAPRGRAAQMNAGAAAVDADLLVFLHADSRLPAGAVGRLREAHADGAVGGFFRVRLDSRRWLLRVVGRLITLRSRITGIATGDQAIWVAQGAFERLGGYARLPLFEDVDLTRRLKRIGPTRCLPAAVVTSARRWERLGTLRTVATMWALRLLYALGYSPARLARHYETAR